MQSIGPGSSIIKSVLHPTDFSEASRVAFHHALKAALSYLDKHPADLIVLATSQRDGRTRLTIPVGSRASRHLS